MDYFTFWPLFQLLACKTQGEFTALVDELSEWLIGQGVTNLKGGYGEGSLRAPHHRYEV